MVASSSCYARRIQAWLIADHLHRVHRDDLNFLKASVVDRVCVFGRPDAACHEFMGRELSVEGIEHGFTREKYTAGNLPKLPAVKVTGGFELRRLQEQVLDIGGRSSKEPGVEHPGIQLHA